MSLDLTERFSRNQSYGRVGLLVGRPNPGSSKVVHVQRRRGAVRNKPVSEPLARALAQDRVAVVEYLEETPERTVDRAYARAVWRLRSAAKEAGIKVRLCRIEDEDGLAVVALPVEELEGQMWTVL